MTLEELKNIPIHFIVGLGRSGTTLLASLLNNHPEVVSSPESKFILYCHNALHYKKSLTGKDIDFFVDSIFSISESRFISLKFWFIDKEQLRQKLYSLLPDIRYLEMCKMVYLNSYLAQGKKEIKAIIDKNPAYTLHLDKMTKTFPEARFIGITRDYRDNAISRHTYFFDSIRDISYHGIIWNEYNKALTDFKKKYPAKIILLQYEDLVKNPRHNLQEIYDFTGIRKDFKPLENSHTYIDYFDKILQTIKPEEKEIFIRMHGRINQKVDSSKTGIWKEKLSDHDVACLDYVCRDTGKLFGYTNQQNPVNISIADKIKVVLFKGYRRAEAFIHNVYYISPIWLRKFARALRNRSFKPNAVGNYGGY